MKKINNKGFAISALIYSLCAIALLTLLLILGTLSGIRKNESSLVEKVKDELNQGSRKTNVYTYKEGVQSYRIRKTGTYRFQLWGGSGGSPNNSNRGGLGGYIEFTKTLNANQVVYIVVGDEGECPPNVTVETFGHDFTTGGKGHCSVSIGKDSQTVNPCGCNGGGASIVVVGDQEHVPTTLEDITNDSLYTVIGIAGGGGGAGYVNGLGGSAYAADGSTITPSTQTAVVDSISPEINDGIKRGTTATSSAPGYISIAGDSSKGKGSRFFGGTNSRDYYKWVGSTFGSNQLGYAGAGGGGGLYGGGAATSSYSGGGGGSNFIQSGSVKNLSGWDIQPKKDNPDEETSQYEEKKGNGKVIITKE